MVNEATPLQLSTTLNDVSVPCLTEESAFIADVTGLKLRNEENRMSLIWIEDAEMPNLCKGAHVSFGDTDIDDYGRSSMTGISCIDCHIEVDARFTLAMPARYYVAALECSECDAVFVEYDAMSNLAV